ncbi:CatB-related O-acetyltransferase [Roseomonas sp. CECT 9278]|uniref:CatB-related O-acetyltransferase n=1 Tax=Roseomonas sp. CECT 9278 TaxID=2845823 RepID=UPI001E2B16A9|nr:CatB-related O-acetyltransferase [Roseomonas sp. CECT 9278]CAH0314200.1 Streptogramin A acetyltransferase [Roseomonas sp. CECT 9278]
MAAPPDPDLLHPIAGTTRTVFLRPLLALSPQVTNVTAGAYSYYHDHEDPRRFLDVCVRYNFGIGRLSIGRYCAIAHRATFLMPAANHAMAGPSTYPFAIMGGAFAEALALADYPWRGGGDITVGHDVWLGTECLVLPGVTIGHGAVVGARAVVTQDVPPYGVVAGNPARLAHRRFDAATVDRLLEIAWWDWPAERVARAIPALVRGDVAALRRA